MRDHPISLRRVWVLIAGDPKTVRREHRPDNPEICLEMNKIAEKRRRFGHRRIGVLLERVGMFMNEKKLYRIYREGKGGLESGDECPFSRRRCLCAAGLAESGRRGSRTPMPVPLRPN